MSAPPPAPARPSTDGRPDEVVRLLPGAGGSPRRRRYDLLGRLLAEEQPDGGELRFSYDERSLRSVEHSSGERVEYAVSPDGRTWSARTDRTVTTVRLSAEGFPVELELEVDGLRWTAAYERDALGRVTACRYPGGDEWLRTERRGAEAAALRTASRGYVELTGSADAGAATASFATGVQVVEQVAPGPAPRLERVTVRDSSGAAALDVPHAYDDEDRVVAGGDRRARYENGRLAGWSVAGQETDLAYGGEGRLVGRGELRLRYGDGPSATALDALDGEHRFEHDALGRRTAEQGPNGVTRYRYDLFGHLASVELPADRTVSYVHDGFGRLVAREVDGEVEYLLHGVEGRLLARAGADGAVTDSYLWLGAQCVGRITGPLGGPLAETYHRVDGAALAAVGDASGRIRVEPGSDPFGADRPLDPRRPGFAGLFGEPLTGLLHAGSRWLDPRTAQLLTPDSWLGDDLCGRYPPELAGVLAALPGGALAPRDPVEALAWCGYDPLNRTDPSGHNWLGLIFSTISAFLWEMQLTSISLQMEVVNIVVWLLFTVIGMFLWAPGFYRDFAIYNIAAPVASARLMVPFAFPLNGVLRFHDRAWTLGSVIWVRGDRLRAIEATSERDLLVCGNASSYLAATQAEASPRGFRVPNAATLRTGTVASVGAASPATAPRITGLTPALSGLYGEPGGDSVSIRISGSTTDEVRRVATVAPSALDLGQPPLPPEFLGQTVEVRRLDPAIVRVTGNGKTLAREVTFVRGQTLHFAGQTPEGYVPNEGLAVAELLPAEQPRWVAGASLPTERLGVRLADPPDLTGYAANSLVRLLSLGTYHARRVVDVSGDRELVLDAPLPEANHVDVEVVRLDPAGAAAPGQTTTGGRVTADRLTDLRPRDGVDVTAAAGAPRQLRIATALLLDCTVDALPSELHGVAVQVDLLRDDGAAASGTVDSATQLTMAAAPSFAALDAVRVTTGGTSAYAVVLSVAGSVVTLRDTLPAPFTAGTAVTVTTQAPRADGTLDADQVAAPGTNVLARVPRGDAIAAGDPIRVRLAGDANGGAARTVAGDPSVVAELDSALPTTPASGLTVQRLAPNDPLRRGGATAPQVRQRLVLPGTSNPYAAGDLLYLVGGERTVVQADAIDGQTVVFAEPVVDLALTATVTVAAVAATGIISADGGLDEGLVLIPSHPEEEPLTRREAIENHEMRHVWQGAVWGPFLLSLPIPWLIDLGFSFGGSANSASKILRHVSVGGLTSALAALVWGIGGAEGSTELEGEVVNAERTLIRFPQLVDAAKVERFSGGSRIDVRKGDADTFNVVDKLESRDLTLRFALEEGRFASGDLVKVTVSPYEEVRKIVGAVFGNFEQLWSDHIPTAWGRALSRLLNTDSWFPFLGIYPLSLLVAGFDEDRLPNEQDAAYHSGDLYTSIALSRESRIFVGQFARVFAFLHPRGAGDTRFGISERGPLNLLEVELPSGVTAADVAGSVPSGGTRVRFREHWYVPMHEKVENVVGALFSSSKPGTYTVEASGALPANQDIVFRFAFALSFLDLRRFEVVPLGVAPDPTQPLFETEVVPFRITGDPSAEYRLRVPAGGSILGTIDGLRYTAPVFAAGAGSRTETLEVTATYAEDHPVFHGPGQLDEVRLTLEERTNLCQELPLTVEEIVAPTLAAVTAGSTRDFEVPIAPVGATATLPASVAATASVIVRPGRPAPLTFVAPAAVTAPVTVTIELVFGTDPAVRKTVTTTIDVTP